MDSWKTLEPTKLYGSATSSGSRFLSRATAKTNEKPKPVLIGKLPLDLYELVLRFVPVPDIPAFGRCSRTFARIVRDGNHWESRWKCLKIDKYSLGGILDDLENRQRSVIGASRANAPPTLDVDTEDDFGEFTIASVNTTSNANGNGFMGDFLGLGLTPTPTSKAFPPIPPVNGAQLPPNLSSPFRAMFIRAFGILKDQIPALQSPPHLILSTLFPPPALSLKQQAQILKLLLFFLSMSVQPLRKWYTHRNVLRAAVDRFDANLLSSFDAGESRGDEVVMKESAEASWEIWDVDDAKDRTGWEMGKVWTEKQEIFYENTQWDPLLNFRCDVPILQLPVSDVRLANKQRYSSTLWTSL
jgi:recyclin-1